MRLYVSEPLESSRFDESDNVLVLQDIVYFRVVSDALFIYVFHSSVYFSYTFPFKFSQLLFVVFCLRPGFTAV